MRSALLVAAAFGGLAAGLYCAAPAEADPGMPAPPPTPIPGGTVLPAPADILPSIGSVLSQVGSTPAGPFGLPDLSGYASNLMLGQNAAPAAPGAPAVTVPDLQAMNPDYLLPQNLTPAAPGQGTSAPGLGPSQEIPGSGRIDFLRRLYEMYQAGQLRGALLGQQEPVVVP